MLDWWCRLRRELPDEWFLPYRWWIWLLTATVLPLLILTSPGPSMASPISAVCLLVALAMFQRRLTDDGEQARQSWLAQRHQMATGGVTPGAVALALAVGLPLKHVVDPTLEIGRQFAWLLQAGAAFDATYASYSSGAGGGAGANGGGGGGAG